MNTAPPQHRQAHSHVGGRGGGGVLGTRNALNFSKDGLFECHEPPESASFGCRSRVIEARCRCEFWTYVWCGHSNRVTFVSSDNGQAEVCLEEIFWFPCFRCTWRGTFSVSGVFRIR